MIGKTRNQQGLGALVGQISIDELEIFDVQLTQPQIASIWGADSAGKCKPNTKACCGEWRQRTPPNPLPAIRNGHGMAYATACNRVVLFGGRLTNTQKYDDTWEWDGIAQTWTQYAQSGTRPSKRHGHSMAYDSKRGRVVLFGGQDENFNGLTDTWEYNCKTHTWQQFTPVHTPVTGISDRRMAYDPFLQKTVLYATVSGPNVKKISVKITKGVPLTLLDFKKPKVKVTEYKEKDVKVIEYSWDTMRFLEGELKKELHFLCKDSNTLTHPKAKVAPIVILDDSQGKIYVSEHAVIEPFSYIKGPCFIGKNALVKSGSKIYGPVSIGEGSRVSGEISGCIFHARVNKQHDGFVGNSYFSEFVNLGADTVTSNLKNNYSKVRAKLFKKEYETDLQFLGSIIGDHTKIGINTMLNTGTVIGAFANIAGGGFPDKFIDSFSWYIIGKKPAKYKIPDALKTCEIVLSRRGIKMTKEFEKLIKAKY